MKYRFIGGDCHGELVEVFGNSPHWTTRKDPHSSAQVYNRQVFVFVEPIGVTAPITPDGPTLRKGIFYVWSGYDLQQAARDISLNGWDIPEAENAIRDAEVAWYRQHGKHPDRITTDRDGRAYMIGDESWNHQHPDRHEEVEFWIRSTLVPE